MQKPRWELEGLGWTFGCSHCVTPSFNFLTVKRTGVCVEGGSQEKTNIPPFIIHGFKHYVSLVKPAT